MSPELIDTGIIFIAGVLATLLTAVVNKAWWTDAKRQWVSFAVSAVLGVVALVLKGTFVQPPPTEPLELMTWIVTTVGLVAGASQVIYMQFSEKIKVLEVATSPAHTTTEEPTV